MVQAGALWSGELSPGIFWVHSSLWKARWISISTHLSLRTMSTPIYALFFLRMVASTSITVRSVIQLAVYMRGSKSTRMCLPSPATPLVSWVLHPFGGCKNSPTDSHGIQIGRSVSQALGPLESLPPTMRGVENITLPVPQNIDDINHGIKDALPLLVQTKEFLFPAPIE
ncbi:hypothetical protein TNCV_3146941 [Trichonephila clavipes]|nr:hypothetical protein TNCV_3146941 [Trichonephila clavipes]